MAFLVWSTILGGAHALRELMHFTKRGTKGGHFHSASDGAISKLTDCDDDEGHMDHD